LTPGFCQILLHRFVAQSPAPQIPDHQRGGAAKAEPLATSAGYVRSSASDTVASTLAPGLMSLTGLSTSNAAWNPDGFFLRFRGAQTRPRLEPAFARERQFHFAGNFASTARSR
jgi:hypothetical protein